MLVVGAAALLLLPRPRYVDDGLRIRAGGALQRRHLLLDVVVLVLQSLVLLEQVRVVEVQPCGLGEVLARLWWREVDQLPVAAIGFDARHVVNVHLHVNELDALGVDLVPSLTIWGVVRQGRVRHHGLAHKARRVTK